MPIYKPKGNILMMTLFVLFASALLGLLVALMMRDFLRYSNETTHYHKANALARAAGELGFAMLAQTTAGFDFQLSSDEIKGFIDQNFHCPHPLTKEKKECWTPFSFSLSIKGLKSQLQHTLAPWASLTVPTFFVQRKGFEPASYGKWESSPTVQGDCKWDCKVSYAGISNDGSITLGEDPILAQNAYFILSNLSSDKAYSAKLEQSEGKLFDGKFEMDIVGSYQDKQVSRQISLSNQLPDFLVSDNYLAAN